MPTLAELNISINSTAVREAKSALDDMTSASARTEAQITGLIRTALELVGVYEALRNVREAFTNALGEERITAGLTNLTGSAQQAVTMIQQLNALSQNSQFALPGLEEDARMLAMMGMSADQVVPTLRNVALGLEAVGAPAGSLNQVVMALVRIREEGQLTRFTIQNLINAGVPA